MAGKQKGFKDDNGKGRVFYHVLNYIGDKRPKVFILENVKGLVTLSNGKDIRKILKALQSVGRKGEASDDRTRGGCRVGGQVAPLGTTPWRGKCSGESQNKGTPPGGPRAYRAGIVRPLGATLGEANVQANRQTKVLPQAAPGRGPQGGDHVWSPPVEGTAGASGGTMATG